MIKLLTYLKNYSACFFLLFFTISLNGQSPALRLQKSYGTSYSDNAYDVRATSDGGYIVLGYGSYNDGNMTCNHGNGDAWILKLDSSFALQWQKCFGGTSNDYLFTWLETNDGGFILAGGTSSNDGDVSGNHSNYPDMWVVKMDSAFNIQWQKCLGGTDSEAATGILATSDGGYIFLGRAESDNDGDVGPNHGMTDVWVVKTDSLANIQWQHCYGGGNYDYGMTILPEDNGGYIFESESSSIDGDVVGNHSFNYAADYWLVRIDSAGSIISSVCLGGSDEDRPTSLFKTSDGGYLASGYEWSGNNGNVTGHHPPIGAATSDIWLIKTDSVFNVQWNKCIGGTDHDWAYNMIKSADGNYIISGATESTDYDVTGYHGGPGYSDWWILKVDSAADIIWKKCFGGSEEEFPKPIIETSDSSLVIAGYTASNDMDVFPNVAQGYNDIWIAKLSPHYNTISGTAFLDTLTNGVHDASEPAVANTLISESATGQLTFTDMNGDYELPVFSPGAFSVQAPYVTYYPMNPSSYPVSFPGIDMVDSLNDFAGVPLPGMNDLDVSITPYYQFVSGYSGAYSINYKNKGTTNLSATLKLFPDAALSFQSATVLPSLANSDSIEWDNINLAPCQTGNIIAYFQVGLVAGVTSSCTIEPLANDQDITNNFSEWTEAVASSYDPNDKSVSDTLLSLQEAQAQTWLDYVIHFQNTGTAPAVNIKILDNIAKKLNMNSFELVSSSHPVQLEYQQASRLMTFRFNNILLPDSNSNEPASHGFIRYRIKTTANQAANTKIGNHAWIYFDFNEPVSTNWIFTYIVIPTGTNEINQANNEINVFPNPVHDKLYVQIPASTGTNCALKLFDLEGRVVLSGKVHPSDNLFIVDLRSFIPGIYLLELKTDNAVYNFKIAKQ